MEIFLDYRKTVETAFDRLETLARIADESVSGRLRTIDVMLQDVAREAQAIENTRDEDSLMSYMKARAESFEEVRSISVSDTKGRLVYSTLPELKDFDGSKRPYFTGPFADQTNEKLFIHGPILASTGKVVVFTSRSKAFKNGKWDGVAVATLPAAYFGTSMDRVRPEDGGFAMLLGREGTIIARSPGQEVFAGKNIANGPAHAAHVASGERMTRALVTTATDGVRTLVVSRTAEYPELVTAVGWPEERVLAAWKAKSLVKGGVLALLALIATLVLRRFAQHEGELLTQRDFARQLIETANVMVVGLDRHGIVRVFNDAAERITGFGKSEILGRPWFEMAGTAADFAEDFYAGKPLPRHFDSPIRTKGGRERMISWQNSTVSGQEMVSMSFGIDMTDRLRAENQLRLTSDRLALAAEAGGIGVWDYDLGTQRLTWDDRMFKLYGIAPGQTEPDYDTWRSACFPSDLPRVEAELAATIRGEAGFDSEFRIITPAGDIRHIKAAAIAERDDDGRPTRVIGVNWDLTAIRENEAALAAAQATAEKANESKSKFLANMSHEIRTPLNAILGLALLLDRTQLSAEQREYAAKITVSGRNLLSIINDILDFSKVEAGRLDLELAEFQLADLLDAVSSIMSVNASAKDLELVIATAPSVPMGLVGDALRLQQVLINLTSNAIKFTEKGEVALRVEQVGTQDGKAVLRFSVEDTGIGIAADVIPTLFEAFTQADSSTTRRYGGSGLGLAICKRLIVLMGGQIGVTSQPGHGSTFWFTVPLTVCTPATRTLASDAGELDVLIADDHDVAREVLAVTASSLGWKSETVRSGRQALERVQERLRGEAPFDVLILDWKMPEMDGLAVSRMVRSMSGVKNSPTVIMVTAQNRDDLLHAPGVEAIDAILVKPITSASLSNAVTEARRRRAGTQAPPAVSIAKSGPRLDRVRLLLVEDNSINQDVAKRVLEMEGATVTLAANGQQAVDRLAADPTAFDVVLMDVQMPIMDGYAATTHIRKELGLTSLPIIALTAGALALERKRAHEAGMDDFIAKPFDVDQMVQSIRRHTAACAPMPSAPQPSPAIELQPHIAAIDMRQANLRLGGDSALFVSLLTRLDQQFADTVSLIRAELASGQGDAAARRLHSLRGAAGNVAATEVATLASEAEAAIRDGRTDDMTGQLDRLDRALGALLQSIRQSCAVAVEAEAITPVAALNRDEAAALVASLEARSLDAIDVFQRLRPALTQSYGRECIGALAHEVDDLAFDRAAERLRDLLG